MVVPNPNRKLNPDLFGITIRIRITIRKRYHYLPDSRIDLRQTSRSSGKTCRIPSLQPPCSRLISAQENPNMRNTVCLLAVLLIAGTLGSGCANYGSNVERKFGRGVANSAEIFRGGEFR